MIGKKIQPVSRLSPIESGSSVHLAVSNLSAHSDLAHGVDLTDISLEVRAGEVLGIAGIAGNGQVELMDALSGEAGSPLAGSISILGTNAIGLNPAARRSLGAVFVPEERIGHAAVADMTLVDNSYLTGDVRMNFSRRGLIDWPAVTRYAENVVQDFDVRTTGVDALASSLSGGNLQKFIVGREILQEPSLLVVSQPTWGVDAGAAAAIHEEIQRLVSAGAAVLMISQDLDEVFLLSHRVAVISQGTLSAALPVDQITPEDIGLLMGIRHKAQTGTDHVTA